MRYLLKVTIPVERGNEALRDPEFGAKVQGLLSDIKAEAAYFTTVNGHRGGYVVVQCDNASKMPSIAEPFFAWLNADVEFFPVMTPEDLGKATPDIAAALQKWGRP